jgi:hypothetical protein
MADDKVQEKLKDQPFAKNEQLNHPTLKAVEPSGENPESILSQAREILDQYGGQQSNIPVHSDYWSLMNKYRAIMGQRNR